MEQNPHRHWQFNGLEKLIKRAVLFSALLFLLVIVGMVIVPAASARSGIIAARGSDILVQSYNYEFIPFSVRQNSELVGAFNANRPVDVYVLNSSEFQTFYGALAPPPAEYQFSSGMATSGRINASLRNGSYYLVFYPSTSTSAIVQVTDTIQLTAS